MQWVVDVLTSEFLWGLVLGIGLSVLTAYAQMRLARRSQREAVSAFCHDTISNIVAHIRTLEDNRDRNRVIDAQFLDIISAEIAVYGRVREHLVAISDPSVRRTVTEFFNKVAAYIARIQSQLAQFYELSRQGDAATDPAQKGAFHQRATEHLTEAHKLCDRLRELGNQQEPLLGRIGRLAGPGVRS